MTSEFLEICGTERGLKWLKIAFYGIKSCAKSICPFSKNFMEWKKVIFFNDWRVFMKF
jgi:hypothetical protein